MNRFLTSALTAVVLAASGAAAFADEPGGVVKTRPVVAGEEVYRHVCQACHMADAKGGVGAAVIPALAGDPRLAVAAYPLTIVIKGRGAMPGFTDVLSPAQIAAAVGYVRTHFGNSYSKPVTEAEVAQMEAALKPSK